MNVGLSKGVGEQAVRLRIEPTIHCNIVLFSSWLNCAFRLIVASMAGVLFCQFPGFDVEVARHCAVLHAVKMEGVTHSDGQNLLEMFFCHQ